MAALSRPSGISQLFLWELWSSSIRFKMLTYSVYAPLLKRIDALMHTLTQNPTSLWEWGSDLEHTPAVKCCYFIFWVVIISISASRFLSIFRPIRFGPQSGRLRPKTGLYFGLIYKISISYCGPPFPAICYFLFVSHAPISGPSPYRRVFTLYPGLQ